MRTVFLTFLVVVTLLQPCDALTKAPAFTLDLDKPPHKRWDGAVELILAAHGWEHSFEPVLHAYMHRFTSLPPIVLDFLDESILAKYPEQYQEMDALAKTMHRVCPDSYPFKANLTRHVLTTFVYFYELGDINDGPQTIPPDPPKNVRSSASFSNKEPIVEESPLARKARAAAKAWRASQGQGSAAAASEGVFASFFSPRHFFRSNHRACTGLLSLPQDKSKDIIHGRNMDEGPPPGRNCTLNITVTRSGRTLFHIFDWVWMTTGLLTGSRADGITLELNWREHGYLSAEQIFARIADPLSVPTMFMFRDLLTQRYDFDGALSYFNTTVFAVPFYTIMSGTKRRGAVITASYNMSENFIAVIDDDSYDTSGKWFMVQTNYDRWVPDNTKDPRRTVAEEHLRMIGPEVGGTELGVWMVASTYPVHNTGTFYTVLLSVAHPPLGYVRSPMLPKN